MEWYARAFVCVAAASFVAACASIAGLEEPVDPTGEPQSAEDAAASEDVRAESVSDAPAPDVCAVKQNGAECAAGSECCTGSCNEKGHCVDQCAPLGSECELASTDECCKGSWCRGEACDACIVAGAQAFESIIGFVPWSCCSREMDDTGRCR